MLTPTNPHYLSLSRRSATLITSCAVMLLLAGTGVGASVTESEHAAGLADYKQGNYRGAVKHFENALAKGDGSPDNYLYMAHSYAGAGNKIQAVLTYRKIADIFKGMPVAAFATQCAQRLDPRNTITGEQKPGAQAAASTAAPKSGAVPAKTLMDRIIMYPPKFGHPEVSELTVDTVKQVVKRVPAHIRKILDDGGATITIAPNIIDKWPGSGDGLKPGEADVTMGEEPGRTYGHEVHIYERRQVRGTTDLKDVRPQSQIRNTTFHEIGHAIDDCSGSIHNDAKYKSLLQLDLDNMPDNVRSQIEYYTQPPEACAETIGGLLGEDGSSAELVSQYMPKSKQFLRERLHL